MLDEFSPSLFIQFNSDLIKIQWMLPEHIDK